MKTESDENPATATFSDVRLGDYPVGSTASRAAARALLARRRSGKIRSRIRLVIIPVGAPVEGSSGDSKRWLPSYSRSLSPDGVLLELFEGAVFDGMSEEQLNHFAERFPD